MRNVNPLFRNGHFKFKSIAANDTRYLSRSKAQMFTPNTTFYVRKKIGGREREGNYAFQLTNIVASYAYGRVRRHESRSRGPMTVVHASNFEFRNLAFTTIIVTIDNDNNNYYDNN